VLQQHAGAGDEKQALLARAEQQARTLEDQDRGRDGRASWPSRRVEIDAARQTLEGERDAALADATRAHARGAGRLTRARDQEDQLHSLRSE
jgi:hypothetical protein